MKHSAADKADIYRLLEAFCEDSLNSHDAEQLSAMLRSSASARLLYRDFFGLHASLRRALRNAGQQPGEPLPESAHGQPESALCDPGVGAVHDADSGAIGPVATERVEACASPHAATKPLPASPVLGFLGTALHLSATRLSTPKVLAIAVFGGLATYFVGLMIYVAITRAYSDPRHSKDHAEALVGGPARIIADSGCQWQDHAPRPDRGGKLPAGTSRLAAGVVELEFDGGARVHIEGPAEFAPRSGQRLKLTRGRIVVYVPKQAHGFTVDTPMAEVIDLGTEFGMEVDGEGSTDLHVMRGRVEVKQVSDPASKSSQRQPHSQRVVAGEAVRVSAGSTAPERITLNTARFDAVRSSSAGEASRDKRSARSFLDGVPIWLGNLFDDDKRTPLNEALRSDTFKATADINDLGVHRCLSQGSAVVEIADAIQFDFTSLGWREDPHQVPVANDAWTPNGPVPSGLQLAQSVLSENGKLEDGIGMHANAVLTFDLDELRAAGGWQDRELAFVCDRSGVNDSALRAGYGSVHMVVIVSGAGGVETLMVDGTVGGFAKRQKIWLATADPGEPLLPGGPTVRWDVPLSSDAKYLTLATTCAGDGIAFDHAVWIGARLEIKQ